MQKPALKPKCSNFSSGPCTKRPGWKPEVLKNALVGRSHRSKEGKAKLSELTMLMREILNLPQDFRIGIVAGSDTGAMELALWTLLGPRPVDIFAWESFGEEWVIDVVKQLKISGVNEYRADYGKIPDLSRVNCANDVVFTLNGSTSGVKVPNLNWIDPKRHGLTICDATSGIFAMELDYSKLDAITFSWQKVLGGEAAHGVIILSPRAAKRMEENEHRIAWPLPKIFRLASEGKLKPGEFECSPINTPSLLCVEDMLDALRWARSIGGLKTLISRTESNLKVLEEWVEKTDWVDFLAESEEIRSSTSVCLKIIAEWFVRLDEGERKRAAKEIVSLLDKEDVAKDINSYKKAPPGLRIWCGATVETSDVMALTPWLDWAYEQVAADYVTDGKKEKAK